MWSPPRFQYATLVKGKDELTGSSDSNGKCWVIWEYMSPNPVGSAKLFLPRREISKRRLPLGVAATTHIAQRSVIFRVGCCVEPADVALGPVQSSDCAQSSAGAT